MRRSLALLIPALALAAACTQSPTDATKHPVVRFEGGNYFGSGNVVGGGGNTMGSGNAVGGGGTSTTTTVTDSAATAPAEDGRGGNTMGSGN
ncbi:MAG TPA: hypothetical protein VEX86_23305 [Longimicrobium sp.]|nr:hypothetical protein [Longimicrobium sp.]